eukprot:GHVU01202912.1.p3 GENE.GHVU01202912.1~~GHVU01202912.1.p3  ORF type:complete len:111 (+),score=3.07 GHVU01202912.1:1508-1840(+)
MLLLSFLCLPFSFIILPALPPLPNSPLFSCYPIFLPRLLLRCHTDSRTHAFFSFKLAPVSDVKSFSTTGFKPRRTSVRNCEAGRATDRRTHAKTDKRAYGYVCTHADREI